MGLFGFIKDAWSSVKDVFKKVAPIAIVGVATYINPALGAAVAGGLAAEGGGNILQIGAAAAGAYFGGYIGKEGVGLMEHLDTATALAMSVSGANKYSSTDSESIAAREMYDLTTYQDGTTVDWDASNARAAELLGRDAPVLDTTYADAPDKLAAANEARAQLENDSDGGYAIWQANNAVRGATSLVARNTNNIDDFTRASMNLAIEADAYTIAQAAANAADPTTAPIESPTAPVVDTPTPEQTMEQKVYGILNDASGGTNQIQSAIASNILAQVLGGAGSDGSDNTVTGGGSVLNPGEDALADPDTESGGSLDTGIIGDVLGGILGGGGGDTTNITNITKNILNMVVAPPQPADTLAVRALREIGDENSMMRAEIRLQSADINLA